LKFLEDLIDVLAIVVRLENMKRFLDRARYDDDWGGEGGSEIMRKQKLFFSSPF
jgi:hypothetical protein